MITELRHRDPFLFWVGAAMLLAFIVSALLSIGDQRLILGLNPWVKPMKFQISITLFLWTVAWFMPETRSDQLTSGWLAHRSAKRVGRTIGLAMTVEILCIMLQSARGTTSHFNHASALDEAIFSIMGIGVVFNTIAMMVFLAIIRRDTPPQRAGYIWGIRLGLALFILASLQGGLIVANDAHTVGAPDGGPGLPFVNWSTEYGDLRIAHFFGMHALQALPLLGFLLDKVNSKAARNVVMAASVLWVVIMGGLLMIALQGRPLLAL